MKRTYRIYRGSTARMLNVTKVIPEDWEEVMIEFIDAGDDYVVIKLKRVV